ncbi:TldD/PmbA family protein [Geodermatophilus sp. SYSU D01106]
MRDPERCADTLLARCSGAEQAEVYGLHRVVTRVEAGTGGELRQVSRAETLGLGLRLVVTGEAGPRAGYASTTDLGDDGLAAVLAAARAAAAAAAPDDGDRLPAPQPVPSAAVPGLPFGADAQDGVAVAVELARRAGALDRRVSTVDLASWREELAEVTVVSTRGVRVRHGRRSVETEVAVVGEDEHGTATGYAGRRHGGAAMESDVEALAIQAVAGATALLGPRHELPAGLPVLLAPEASAALVGALGRALTGPALAGAGPFRGAPGSVLASPAVTLVDDALSRLAPAAGPVDDEGVPRRVTTLLDRGQLAGALQSTGTAEPGTPSTGSALRSSHRSLPVVGPTLLRLVPTAEPTVGDAVVVRQLSGEGAGVRPVTGRIDVGAVAHLLRDGRPAGRLPVLPLATTLGELWGAVVAVAGDGIALPASPVLAPTVMLRPGLL